MSAAPRSSIAGFDDIVGNSPALRTALGLLQEVASTDSTALLLGETGTGKELFAKALHMRSSRRQFPIVSVNCAALPPTLIESELFGHERGAFTDAVAQRQGRFELAHRGTLFLDEIDLPLELQAKLLRVLQEGSSGASASARRRSTCASSRPRTVIWAAPSSTATSARSVFGSTCFRSGCPAAQRRGHSGLVWATIRKRQRAVRHRLPSAQSVMDALMRHEWPSNIAAQNVVGAR